MSSDISHPLVWMHVNKSKDITVGTSTALTLFSKINIRGRMT